MGGLLVSSRPAARVTRPAARTASPGPWPGLLVGDGHRRQRCRDPAVSGSYSGASCLSDVEGLTRQTDLYGPGGGASDSTIIEAATMKPGVAGHFKGGIGHHPLTAWCSNIGDPLAVMHRLVTPGHLPGSTTSMCSTKHWPSSPPPIARTCWSLSTGPGTPIR